MLISACASNLHVQVALDNSITAENANTSMKTRGATVSTTNGSPSTELSLENITTDETTVSFDNLILVKVDLGDKGLMRFRGHEQRIAKDGIGAPNFDSAFINKLVIRYGVTLVSEWSLKSIDTHCFVFRVNGSRSAEHTIKLLRQEAQITAADVVKLYEIQSFINDLSEDVMLRH